MESMAKTVPLKVTALLVVSAMALATFFVVGAPAQSSDATIAASFELTQELLQERTKTAIAAALAHPQVKSIVEKAEIYAADYHMLEGKDHVTVSTWGSQTVEGDWKEGYIISLTGGKIVNIDVDRVTNAVTEVQVSSRPDEKIPITFTDNQKLAIETSLTNPAIQEFTANNEYYISLVRDYGNVQFRDKDCGFDDCAIVQFTNLTGNGGASTIVNTKTGDIHYANVVSR
jgi:hypothetical protein